MPVPSSWITRVKDGTPEWHAARRGHIGASEAAIVLGMSEYRPTRTELYHIKVGTHVAPFFSNEPVFHGKHQEAYAAWLWTFYDRPGDSYVTNANNENIIRKCRNVNGMIVNPKYPYLACNLDREAVKGSYMLNESGVLTSNKSLDNFPVEVKTINGYSEKKWESGIPQSYVVQVHQQMLITRADYSEIAIFIDGRKFKVYPIPFNKWLGREIIDKCHDFWNLVVAGREYYKIYLEALSLGKEGEAMAEDAMAKIYEFEPEPDGSNAYKEYYSERMKKEQESMMGDETMMRDAILHKQIKDLKESLEDIESEVGNRLRYACVKNKVEKIMLPNGTYIRLYKRNGSENLTLDNRSKKTDPYRVRLMKESILKTNLGMILGDSI